MSGGVIIARNLWNDPAFQNEPFSEREAWVWMICEAGWKPREKRVGKVIVQLDRGQLAASIRFMAEAFSWHRNKADRFLKRLEKCNLIRVESGTGVNVITLCKYNEYQLSPKSFGTEAGQKRDRSGTNENKGEIREESKSNTSSSDDGFELFWSKVPRKVAKGGARKAFKAALKKASMDEIMKGMEGYAASVKGKDPQYIAHPATWLTQERWADDTKSADTRTWRDKPESEWTNKDRTEWAKAML